MSTTPVPRQATVKDLEAEVLRLLPSPEEATLEELKQAEQELSLKFHIHVKITIVIVGKKGGKTTITISF